MTQQPITIRFTPYKYTGWRRFLRRLTFRPVESPTYEFEAMPPGTRERVDGWTETSFTFTRTGPVRRVDP